MSDPTQDPSAGERPDLRGRGTAARPPSILEGIDQQRPADRYVDMRDDRKRLQRVWLIAGLMLLSLMAVLLGVNLYPGSSGSTPASSPPLERLTTAPLADPAAPEAAGVAATSEQSAMAQPAEPLLAPAVAPTAQIETIPETTPAAVLTPEPMQTADAATGNSTAEAATASSAAPAVVAAAVAAAAAPVVAAKAKAPGAAAAKPRPKAQSANNRTTRTAAKASSQKSATQRKTSGNTQARAQPRNSPSSQRARTQNVVAATGAVAAAAVATSATATAGKADADVDLLAALMAHVDGAPERQPSTIAGLVRECRLLSGAAEQAACRQRICADYWGKAQACPAEQAPRVDRKP